jgi:hypothetical protein
MNQFDNNQTIFDDLPAPPQKAWIRRLMIIPVVIMNILLIAGSLVTLADMLFGAVEVGDIVLVAMPTLLIYGLMAKTTKGWMGTVAVYYFILGCLFYAVVRDFEKFDAFISTAFGIILFSIPLLLLHSRALGDFYKVKDRRRLWLKGVAVALPAIVVAAICGYLHLI